MLKRAALVLSLLLATTLNVDWHLARPTHHRLAHCARRAVAARRHIMSRRVVSDEAMAQWFHFQAVAQAIAAMEIPQAVLT